MDDTPGILGLPWVLHLDGPVTVRRGRRRLTEVSRVPPGGMFLHPAGTTLDVELGGPLKTVHVYVADDTLRAAVGEDHGPVRLNEELGVTDPLLEQLVLALDGVARIPTNWSSRSLVNWPGGTATYAAPTVNSSPAQQD
ncbi:hypothetical protein [Streptomyces pseudovenezuelae]|uniref:hypothetical protein n=1 Tax=Streptomyces pseudovenezuelae TaxID=67350 RepID=UPI002473B88F|nr:hypothetical protein [Streptomyces pseudovenezuelae]